jgi:2-polyprenyl-6-methoxyphenol hydroxylase-like FAD-dependent oxidoreductase
MTTWFRVIIVGGGPVGLMAAHAFSAAGLDFVLLERRNTVVGSDGASLAIYPHTLRVMDQLHLLEPLERIKSTMKHAKSLTHGGVCYNTAYTYDWCMEK